MIALNYSIQDNNGPLPLGTLPSVNTDNGPAKVIADTVNAGRYQVQYPTPGETTITVIVNGRAPFVYADTIPTSGGEAGPSTGTTNNPMVLSPL